MGIEEYLAAMKVPECDRILYCDTEDGVWDATEEDDDD